MSTSRKPAKEEANKQFSLSASLGLEEIRWSLLSDRLVNHYGMTERKCEGLIKKFRAFFEPFLEINLFRRSAFDPEMHQLIAGLCEVYNAERIIVSENRTYRLLGLKIPVRVMIAFMPSFPDAHSKAEGGVSDPCVVVELLSRQLLIRDRLQVASIRLLLFMLAVAAYVAIVGGALYCIAVLVVFHRIPAETLLRSLKDPYIGTGLLTGLVAVAFLIGALVRYVGKQLFRSK